MAKDDVDLEREVGMANTAGARIYGHAALKGTDREVEVSMTSRSMKLLFRHVDSLKATWVDVHENGARELSW